MTPWMEIWTHAWRSLRRHPAYSLFAIGTLAVAIGGGTLLFSLYDAIALRDLPVARPGELVSIRDLSIDPRGKAANLGRLSLDDFEALRNGATPLADVAAYAPGEAVVRAGSRTERSEVQWVDPRYFDVLGVKALRGRLFAASDDPRRGGAGGVVLSGSAWSRLFGGADDAVGSTVELDGVPWPVLGVAPEGFHGFDVGSEPALFALASQVPDNWDSFHLFGRLRAGVTLAALESRLEATLTALRAQQPGRRNFMIVDGRSSTATERIEVADGSRGESGLRGEAELPLALVGGLLALVLLVLAANLANLLAVRALASRRAAAVRLALGAPRAVIAGSWFGESLLLTLSGAVLGLAAVAGGGRALLGWAPLPVWVHGLEPRLDPATVAVAVGLAVGVAFIVGSLAAWEQARVEPELRLREESPSATIGRRGLRWRNGLIAAQVALSVVLLVAMGLFVRSAAALLDIDTGFPLARVLTFQVDLPEARRYPAAELERLRSELERQPGVEAAGFASNPVLEGVRGYAMAAIEGYTPKSDEVLLLNTLRVSPGFFRALDLHAAAGRVLAAGDLTRSPSPAVVNRRFAERYFPGGNPIGRRVSFNFQRTDWSKPSADDLVIVGVVDDRMMSDVREKPAPRLYALPQSHLTSAAFFVRTGAAPQALAPTLARLFAERAPEAAVGTFRTLEDQRDRSLRRELLTRDLTLVFGALAAALAALGLFAVLSYVVGERRRELGLRQALGAAPPDLLRRVLVDGFRPVLWGLAAGLGIAVSASRVATSQLYGVAARDPLSFVAALVLMAFVGVTACLPPALRASRSDPAQALRNG